MTDIFSPFSIKGVSIQNRIMRSATAERMADDQTGFPKPAFYQHYQDLADGGVGLIITGHMYVDRAGKCHPEMTAIDQNEVVPYLKRLTDLVHQTGSKIIPQINFGGLQCSTEVNTINLAPSLYPNNTASTAPNREITSHELDNLISAFARAAGRVQQAGFDGVMLHGAHGYFINQMLSPAVNHRNDRWGGTFDRRLTFLREVTSAVRTTIGAQFPMLIKLGMQDGVEEGLTLKDGLTIVEQLESMGIDAVEISGGFRFSSIDVVRRAEDEAYFRPWAQEARKRTTLPILLVGGFRTKAVMNEVLAAGDADMVSLCRSLICEPDLIQQFQNSEKTKADCISCNRCFAKNINEGTKCRWKVDRISR